GEAWEMIATVPDQYSKCRTANTRKNFMQGEHKFV
ncbi:hypothetical protein E2320_020513, partial [Naja naja]